MAAIEQAHVEWVEHGRPGRERLGLTVTPDGLHLLWLDDPRTALLQFGAQQVRRCGIGR